MNWNHAESSPPQLRRGGAKRRGGVGQQIDFIEQHHPSLPFGRLSPPQLRRGVCCRSNSFTPSYDRACRVTFKSSAAERTESAGLSPTRRFFQLSKSPSRTPNFP